MIYRGEYVFDAVDCCIGAGRRLQTTDYHSPLAIGLPHTRMSVGTFDYLPYYLLEYSIGKINGKK